jgi:hypothetical protein
MHDGSNDAVCLEWVSYEGRVDMKSHFVLKTPTNPNFGTQMPIFHSSQYNWINFERYEVDEKFQTNAYTKSGSRMNGDVISAAERLIGDIAA